jgi:hypothetical protein
MEETIDVPVSLLRKMEQAVTAFAELGDELEDFLLARNGAVMTRMRDARAAHLAGEVRPLDALKRELCIE